MDQVQSMVNVCTRYWRRTRVPKPAIAEMRVELESHLREAIVEGKSVASVVGNDVTGFAEQWAREYRRPFIQPSGWAGVVPAILALLVGGPMFLFSFAIPVTSVATTIECCPRRVVDRIVEEVPGGEFLFWVVLAVAALSLLAAVLLLFGRFTPGSIALAAGAVAAALTPPGWLASLILLVALLWTQWIVRRAYRRNEPALTT